VIQQAADLVQAFAAWRAIDPQAEIHGGHLDWQYWQNRENLPRYFFNKTFAYDIIAEGALQLVASRLLGQGPQERAGETEIVRGVRALEKAHAEENEAILARRRASRPKRP
jgi:hypothetical protein